MVLEAIVAPHAPEVLLLSAFSSFDELLEVRGRVAAHWAARQARARLESGDAPVLEGVQSQVLTTVDEPLRTAARSAHLRDGVFELRSFHAAAWQDAPPTAVGAIFSRAGVQPIVNAARAAGEHVPQYTYLVPFKSLATRQDAWARVESDPAWKEMQRDSVSQCGSFVKVTAKSIYKLAPYSPLA
jgi:hypothetical protein